MDCKAVFFDRDGVINVDKSYIYMKEDFEFCDGIFDLMHYFQRKGYKLFIVTNQSGVARGYFSEMDFWKLTDWMLNQLRERDIYVEKVYFCPYHPTKGLGKYLADSYNRKPNPGMIKSALSDYEICPEKSIIIGDKESDILAGKHAGLWKKILIKSQYNLTSDYADIVVDSVRSLYENIINNNVII